MEQNQLQRSNTSRPYQFNQNNPYRTAIFDLFNVYLGKSSRQKTDDSIRETPNKLQKRVTAINRDFPPPNEQFLFDFEQLQSQFTDQEQLRSVTESVLIALVVQCCNHSPRAEFVLFALRSLCNIGYINWDSFLPSLLSSVSSAEISSGQGGQATNVAMFNSASQAGLMATSSMAPNSSNFQPSVSASPLPSIHGIGSPAQSTTESSSAMNLSPVKISDNYHNAQQTVERANVLSRDNITSCLRQMSCKIILIALDSNLKPVTHADVFAHMLNWLVEWDQKKLLNDDFDGSKAWKSGRALNEWLHSCLDVIWLLVDEVKCRVPFYELLRSGLQFIDKIPDDEALFTLILEIHRRRDMVAMHMQMLDQHLHCPTFGTHRFLSQGCPSASSEPSANTRHSPILYPSVLGEPLHGEDLATSIQKGSLDWERALRCLRHALRSNPSAEWWRRVLVVAPCYPQNPPRVPSPGASFSSEMICEAVIDRTVELLKLTNSETHCWQEWLIFSDIFYFLLKIGGIDFLDFVHKLASRVEGENQILQSNHVTWLLAQVIRIDVVTNALNMDPKKVETTRKILSFHKEEKSSDASIISPQSILLDFISSSQTLRIWSINASIREYLNHEQLEKGRQIDEWWKQFNKGERITDYMNLDDRSIGMFWVLSYTMAQPACEAVMNWLTAGGTELLPGSSLQSNERPMVMRECCPLPMSLLYGLSTHLCSKLAVQIEDSLFISQVIPSIAMVETYVRLLLIYPHSLFRSHFAALTQKIPSILSRPAVSILLLEILNYRLIPLYRYHGKSKSLMHDVTKLVSVLKAKRGDHRVFRLAENLSLNLILSFRDFFPIKKEMKGPSDFTETLNRVAVLSLAITIKTRGLAEVDHVHFLPSVLEQILATCQHTWSEKTLRYFPPLIRDILMGQMSKRGHTLQAWQQTEATVLNQCTQLLFPSADPAYVMTYINHSFPQHRQHLCAGAWMLMHGHPENINGANLGRVLREFSPEEVTSNIYTMVDVLLHNIHTELNHGHLLQELLVKATTNLAFFIWTHELLPFDILLLALIDRDDDPHALRIVLNLIDRPELKERIKLFISRGHPEHWLYTGIAKRTDLQKALGSHLSWKERYPPFFDDIAARLLPIIPLIIYRLIENDATDIAEKVVGLYKPFLAHYPLRFTFVRDILAYFYGHLPSKLIVRILSILDITKIPLSESFPKHVSSSNPVMCPPQDYFASLLLSLVNNVIPPLNSKSRSGSTVDTLHAVHNKSSAASQSGPTTSEGQKAFYQIQDPGTYSQLVLETAVIELLSLPVSPTQIVSSLVQVVVNVQPTLIQSSNGLQGTSSSVGQGSVLPTSPSGGSSDSLGTNRSTPSASVINASNFVSRSGYSCQQLSCLLIQACGLLLAQLPPEFHGHLYLEASRVIKDCWWLTDGKSSQKELDSVVGYTLLDPTWAAQDNTSTAIGNIVALLHSFFNNLPHEWLEETHSIIKHLKPVTSVAMLRITFRIMGPLLPRVVSARSLFGKTLALLLNGIADVFGRNSMSTTSTEASGVADLIDFLYHAILYEGQGGPVQSTSKPKLETLAMCGEIMEMLRPDIQHLLSHLRIDPNTSIYAATHPKLVQNPG